MTSAFPSADGIDAWVSALLVEHGAGWLRLAVARADGDRQFGEDALNEALHALAVRRVAGERIEHPANWVAEAIRRSARSRRRKERSQRRLAEHWKDRHEAASAGPAEVDVECGAFDPPWSKRLERLRRALPRLGKRQRRVVELRLLEGLAYPEIAALLACSPATARSLWRDAVRSLRNIPPDFAPPK